jgi:hypothetical protein
MLIKHSPFFKVGTTWTLTESNVSDHSAKKRDRIRKLCRLEKNKMFAVFFSYNFYSAFIERSQEFAVELLLVEEQH